MDISRYYKRYDLKTNIASVKALDCPQIDIDSPGLIMHGSEADPLNILKYGLVPQQPKGNPIDTEWQVCMGINSSDPGLRLERDLSRKNPAIRYAGHFDGDGMVYVLSDEVRSIPSYREYWQTKDLSEGCAWVKQPILPQLIVAVIATNLPLIAAAMIAVGRTWPVYTPQGRCFSIQPIS